MKVLNAVWHQNVQLANFWDPNRLSTVKRTSIKRNHGSSRKHPFQYYLAVGVDLYRLAPGGVFRRHLDHSAGTSGSRDWLQKERGLHWPCQQSIAFTLLLTTVFLPFSSPLKQCSSVSNKSIRSWKRYARASELILSPFLVIIQL